MRSESQRSGALGRVLFSRKYQPRPSVHKLSTPPGNSTIHNIHARRRPRQRALLFCVCASDGGISFYVPCEQEKFVFLSGPHTPFPSMMMRGSLVWSYSLAIGRTRPILLREYAETHDTRALSLSHNPQFANHHSCGRGIRFRVWRAITKHAHNRVRVHSAFRERELTSLEILPKPSLTIASV